MSPEKIPNKPKSKISGCAAFGILVTFLGTSGLIMIGMFFGGYALQEILTAGNLTITLPSIWAPPNNEAQPDVAPEVAPEVAPQVLPPDSASFDSAACIPHPGVYRFEVTDKNDRTSSGGKHVCGADVSLTNTGDQTLLVAAFRINNYGAEETKYPEGKWWRNQSYSILEPGESISYRFYHCTGPGCDGGEWYYIQRVSILFRAPGCLDYASTFEDLPPESIVPIENPCSW